MMNGIGNFCESICIFNHTIFYYRLERNSVKILLITNQRTLYINWLLLVGASVHTDVNFTEEFAKVLRIWNGKKFHIVK